jgi:hypothetical protein
MQMKMDTCVIYLFQSFEPRRLFRRTDRVCSSLLISPFGTLDELGNKAPNECLIICIAEFFGELVKVRDDGQGIVLCFIGKAGVPIISL